MAEKMIIFFLIVISATVHSKEHEISRDVCMSVQCSSVRDVKQKLKDCVVIMGNLKLAIMERTRKEDFANVSFPKLREVTGFLLVYRVQGIQSLGDLFPNLARIRGEELLNNYALIVYDMPKLKEIGLYSLLKIDRGGVIIWGLPQACYVNTIDWKVIAPRARHIISHPDKLSLRSCASCTCSLDPVYNRCWNRRKCQLFLEGPEAENCSEECLGCRKTNSSSCFVCRHFTYNGTCVTKCPDHTLLLEANQFCITEEDCEALNGWSWNKTCVFECPVGYIKVNKTEESGRDTCEYCASCQQTCESLSIQTTGSIQAAERCVIVNGSLTIHLGSLMEAMTELRSFLRRIEEISEYLAIYSSSTVTSLDFLPSLKRIRGLKLFGDKFSIVIHDMINLYGLFNEDVMNNLKIDNGSLQMFHNPLLCMNHVDKLKALFPEEPEEKDIIEGSNGYGGNCEEASVDIQIRVLNETSVVVMFSAQPDPDMHYSVLYVRLPAEVNRTILPETCSELQWFSEAVPSGYPSYGIVQLTSLRPASTYAICIETYDPVHNKLARSKILNFTTLVGIPEPPFIIESVASSFDVVVLNWVDHKDYRRYITRYELDVVLLDSRDVLLRNYCINLEDDFFDIDYTRHAVVMRPPPEYGKNCESMCGFLSTVTPGALAEDFFDVCDTNIFDCNIQEGPRPGNSSFNSHVNTISLNITGPKTAYQVGNLAPYRDYKFRLRACFDNLCSRSAKSTVRTMRAFNQVDIPKEVVVHAKTESITVHWKPPDVTNGPILSYTVEVLPSLELDSYLIPQTWCVMGNVTYIEILSLVSSNNKVRVCTTSLASLSTCNDWVSVELKAVHTPGTWFWWSLPFGILVMVASVVIGSLCRHREDRSDTVSLVEWTNE